MYYFFSNVIITLKLSPSHFLRVRNQIQTHLCGLFIEGKKERMLNLPLSFTEEEKIISLNQADTVNNLSVIHSKELTPQQSNTENS